MLTVFTGTPGSGKTYRAVYDAWKNRSRYHIVHNIDGLNDSKFPSCVHIDTLGGMEETIDYDWWLHYCRCVASSTVSKKHPKGLRTLLIVDECYRYFDRPFGPQLEFLASHRHAGMDIWLIAQDMQMIALPYRKIVEFEIRCKSGFLFKIPGMFLYAHRSSKQDFSYSIRFARSHIYKLYQSAFIQGGSKGSLLIPLALMIIIPLAYFGFTHNPVPPGSNSTARASLGPSSASAAEIPDDQKSSSPRSDDEHDTAYLGPKILGHQGTVVAYAGSDGKPLYVSVREFVNLFSPEIYGYSYVHAPGRNRFILMDRATSRILYPVDNPIHVVQYIKSESASDRVLDDPGSIVPLTQEQKDASALRALQNITRPFVPILRAE